jgi:hypothetical protein
MYFDLKESRLFTKIKITKADGKPITKDDKVGPVNLTLQSYSGQVDIMLNQTVVTNITGVNYAYKAYLDMLLNNGKNVKEMYKVSEMYVKDTSGNMDNILQDTANFNVGLLQRSHWLSEGKVVDLNGPLYADICQQDRLLIPNIPLQIKL